MSSELLAGAPLDAAESERFGALHATARKRRDGLIECGSQARDVAPFPLPRGSSAAYLRARTAGKDWRASYESLMWELAEEQRGLLRQISKESHGAWHLLLESEGGRLLFVGNSFSGALAPLAANGFLVTLYDESVERLTLGLRLLEGQVAERCRGVIAATPDELPFPDATFDVVVCDLEQAPSDSLLAELGRVSARELVVLGDNRLGYKRSRGGSWDFHVPGPLEYTREAVAPRSRRHSLIGWRRRVRRAGGGEPRAFALYPDRRDFAHVVSLDGPLPALHIAPGEARNKLKMAARRAGLFPILAPSFALITSREQAATPETRLDRHLAALADLTGEPLPLAEHLIGTRGNTAVVMTKPMRGHSDGVRGRWLLHLPLYQGHQRGLALHAHFLELLTRDFPQVPVPELLHCGEAGGLWSSCERRLGGWSAHHALTDGASSDQLLALVGEHLAQLQVAAGEPLTEQQYDEEIQPLFEDTLGGVRDTALRDSLKRRSNELRLRLVGRVLPRVVVHGDLRAKHIQLGHRGEVLGYLDWGTSLERGLPVLDLVHLMVHNRKQLEQRSEGEIWRELINPQTLRPRERDVLKAYTRSLDIDDRVAQALVELYPLFVGATAERWWPATRPGWFRRQFGFR